MAPSTVVGDDLLDELQRTGIRDSLVGRPLRPRQRWILAGIAAVLIGLTALVTIWVRQPDPYTYSKLVPWRHPVVSPDGLYVTLTYDGGIGCGTESVRTIAQESASRVALSLVVVGNGVDDGTICAGGSHTEKAVAHLRQPLGSRTLVDGRCAQPRSLDPAPLRCSVHGYNARAWPPH